MVSSGLLYLAFTPAIPAPAGRLVDVGGYQLHIDAVGEQRERPTVVIEAGAGLPTEFYYWLSEGLKDSLRVVRYDRAGLGHSDKSNTPRNPETIARELRTLLENAGEKPPFLMMGHSLGGPFIRVFADLYPDEVAGLFFLDATHQDQVERYNAPKETSFVYKAYLFSIGAQAVLGDMGVMALYDELFDTPYFGEGLPPEMNDRIKGLLRSGKSFWTFRREMKQYYATLKRCAEADDFGSIPIRSFSAVPELSKRNSSEVNKPVAKKKYVEFVDMSTDGKHFDIVSNHVTIFSKKENAEIICREVLRVVAD